jgi:hypothetical protein
LTTVGAIETIETVDVKMTKDGEEIDQEDTYGFADAAKKAVMDIGNLPPAENEEGKPVDIKFSLPITFRLR